MTLKLTRQEQKVIEKLLIERPSRRKANKTLLKLVGQGFGALAANHIIIYNQKDFADIAKVIDKLNISDDLNAPSQLNAASNRLEVAKYRADEKWSQATVFAQQILIVGMDCPIPLLKPSSNEATQILLSALLISMISMISMSTMICPRPLSEYYLRCKQNFWISIDLKS